ncbi:DUF2971 domain-containing protein [Lutibacter citreus]|uniref:DUF2971 domain-containing protein n=1 Tax=Lutibacter citreus TaxID=2138210 RepID=UPI000DBE0385|nr:DUF2971 domain-containing protein [Lutibacter citreus]
MKNGIIYKYLSVKDALRVVMNKTLKFSQPFDFNDPFDCYEKLLKFDVTEEFIKEHLEKGILQLDENERKLSSSELISHLKKNTYTFENNDVKKVFENSKKQLWISCFSKTYKEILMWSHYGNNHKGVCIGFNYKGLSETFDFIPSKVKYKKKFKKVDYCNDYQKALNYLINTKSKNWKYEKEIRLRTNKDFAPSLNENGIISIKPSSISRIIIGCNCNINLSSLSKRLTKMNYSNVELIKLSKSENSFSFDEARI